MIIGLKVDFTLSDRDGIAQAFQGQSLRHGLELF
jgi:hypothetical protein